MRKALSFLALLAVAGPAVRADSLQIDLQREVKKENRLIQQDVFGQPLQNKWNVQYVGYVSLGEPAQRFRTIFDTGSFSLWVPRKGCTATGPKAENCANKTELYDSKKSKTAKELKGQVYNETYGTGGAVGATFTDVFAFGDPKAKKQLKLKNPITFGAAEKMTHDDTSVLGLGLGSSSQGTNILQQALKEKLFTANLFTTFMRRCPEDKLCEQGGVLTLGALDSVNCGPVQHWAAVVDTEQDRGHWQFKLDGLSLDGVPLPLGEARHALSDTGTSHVLVPPAVFAKIAEKVKPSFGTDYVYDCAHKFSLTLKVGGQDLELTQEHLFLPSNFPGKCLLGVQPDPNFPHLILLGDPFHRAFCQVHDVENKRLGFAKPK